MTTAGDQTRVVRARPGRRAAWRLLLALLWLGTIAVAASHHHDAGASAACQACHAAHGAALTAAATLPSLAPGARTLQPVPQPHQTILAVDLRVRGPPSADGAA